MGRWGANEGEPGDDAPWGDRAYLLAKKPAPTPALTPAAAAVSGKGPLLGRHLGERVAASFQRKPAERASSWVHAFGSFLWASSKTATGSGGRGRVYVAPEEGGEGGPGSPSGAEAGDESVRAFSSDLDLDLSPGPRIVSHGGEGGQSLGGGGLGGADGEDWSDFELLERGYAEADEFFLHAEQVVMGMG